MARGRYLKSAERACAGKRRYESAREAETASEGRFGVYPCPVCAGFHLTSSLPGARPPEPRTRPLARLGNLDWPEVPPPPPVPDPTDSHATVTGALDRSGRAPLLVGERRVWSAPVGEALRGRVGPGVRVRIAWESGRAVLVALAV